MSFKSAEEWFSQAEYDIDTAEFLFSGGRYIYAIFMIQLSLEKALKGLWANKFADNPPKTHDLEYLYRKIEINAPQKYFEIISEIDEVSVLTRYPEELKKLIGEYNKETTLNILSKSKEAHKWLKTQL